LATIRLLVIEEEWSYDYSSLFLLEDLMFYEDKLYKFIDITKFYTLMTGKSIHYVNYSIITEPDKSVSIVFTGTNDVTKSHIFISKKGFKIRTPLCLQPFIGKKIIIYNDYISSSINELFRIKPIDFKFENMVGIKYRYPYFTGTSLIVPFFYINKHLNEYASILRVSMALTNELILKKNQIRVMFNIKKNNELLSYPLYQTTNGLKTKTMTKFLDLIDDNNKFLEKFIYIETVNVSFSVYGIMIFKEDR
jgi:hypothetical protein